MFHAMAFMDRETKFKKGTSKLDIIRFYDNVMTSDINRTLRTEASEGPFLAVFTKDGEVEMTAIAGDTVVIQLHSTDAVKSTMCLLAMYYVFDIEYPKPYSMGLGLLQQHVIGELFLGYREVSPKGQVKMKKSQGFATIMAALDTALNN